MRSLLSFAFLALLPWSQAKSRHSLKKRSCPAKNSTSPASPAANSSVVSAAWYAGWHSDDFPLDAVSWDKYTHLTYSFA